MKAVKLPVIIDTMQYTGTNGIEIIKWVYETAGDVAYLFLDGEGFFIETLEGLMKASPSDWIIIGVDKEVYPCKDSVFQQTYEVLE